VGPENIVLDDATASRNIRRMPKILGTLFLFAFFAAAYVLWMTGPTLSFRETLVFPTYNMLARSFLKGHAYIEAMPSEDYSEFEGRKYLYFGPGPIIFHFPSVALANRDIPTGLVIVMLMASTVVVCYKIMACLENGLKSALFERLLFTTLFALNGFSLFMVSIPSIHHEAIASATFFLLCGTYFVLRHIRDDCKMHVSGALVAGFCFLMALLCRSSSLLSILFLFSALVVHCMRRPAGETVNRGLRSLAPLAAMIVSGMVFTGVYNYIRFGSFADFGVRYMASSYRDYFLSGHYFRYDHIPYNLWSYLFRLPDFSLQRPHMTLPFYILQVKSVDSDPYFLLHINELSVSVFLLMPVLIFCFGSLLFPHTNDFTYQRRATRVVFVLVILQILPLLLTVAATARYYHDFLPMLLLLSYLGYLAIREKMDNVRLLRLLLVLCTLVSLIMSFTVALAGLEFYK
jgi:hypothetical protein